MRLNPEELVVSTFDTTSDTNPSDADAAIITDNPNDPTPATWCRICPVGTDVCY